MAAKIRVLIADDHLIFRLGLRTLLSGEPNISLAGEATTGSQTIERFRELRPDVLLLDLRMPDGGGMGALCASDRPTATPRF
jgi:DNA-binding NarL/FixJ family response regulator